MQYRPLPSHHRHGFSLVELSIVVAILSVVATLGLEVMAGFVNRTAYSTTQDRVDAASVAVKQFFTVYGRLPCPATRSSNPTTDTTYGLENCNVPCFNASGGTNVWNTTCTTGGLDVGGGVLVGTLPFRTLNLPVSASLDGFGDKLNYFVTANLAVAGSNYHNDFGYKDGTAGTPDTSGQDGLGGIEIRHGVLASSCTGTSLCSVAADPKIAYPNSDASTNRTIPYSNFYISTTPGAAYAIFSNGADKRGAVSRNGTAQVACNAVSANRIDTQNCAAVTSTTPGVTGIPLNVLYDSRFSNGSNVTNYFDDVIVWARKDEL